MKLNENKLKGILDEYTKTKSEELKAQIIEIVTNMSISDLRLVLFEALVPPSGNANTVAGEMIRAVNKIGHRFFNDGDIYFAGYGIETAGSPAIYLSKINKVLETLITRLYPEQYLLTTNVNKSYKNFILTLEARIIQLIQTKPDLLLKRNVIDSVNEYITEAAQVFRVYDELINDGSIEQEDGDLDDFLDFQDSEV